VGPKDFIDELLDEAKNGDDRMHQVIIQQAKGCALQSNPRSQWPLEYVGAQHIAYNASLDGERSISFLLVSY
jgi:hypothetical protein